MITNTRRETLAGIGAALGMGPVLGAGTLAAAPARPLRIRKSVFDLSPNGDELFAYRKAIRAMRNDGAWERQVRIHANMKLLHHSSWRFLPWHRLQLIALERLVAHYSGHEDFAMPYWDWSKDRIPPVFLDDDTFWIKGREAKGSDSIAEFLARNRARFTARMSDDFATFFGRPRTQSDRRDTTRRYFSGSAEWSGHNLIHDFVGGAMGQLNSSPRDPLFWLHHANVDRAWASWSLQHGSGGYDPRWLQEGLSGYVDAQGRTLNTVLARATTDTPGLGYTYDAHHPPIAFGYAPEAAARRPPRIKDFAFAMRRISAHKGVIDVPAALARAFSVKATGFIAVATDEMRAASLRISAHAASDGSEVFNDTIFITPMGMMEGQMHAGVRRFRIDLSGAWNVAETRGLRLEVEAGALVGREAGGDGATLAGFVVDARASFE